MNAVPICSGNLWFSIWISLLLLSRSFDCTAIMIDTVQFDENNIQGLHARSVWLKTTVQSKVCVARVVDHLKMQTFGFIVNITSSQTKWFRKRRLARLCLWTNARVFVVFGFNLLSSKIEEQCTSPFIIHVTTIHSSMSKTTKWNRLISAMADLMSTNLHIPLQKCCNSIENQIS